MNTQTLEENPATAAKGLEAIPAAAVLQLIPVKDLADSPYNPRQRFGKDALKKLTESVKLHGILDPLAGRPIIGGKIELVKGHRRKRAAIAAGLDAVPVLVRKMTDMEVMVIQLVELEQSADVHPLEQAFAYRRLKEAGKAPAEIAREIGGKGMSESHVWQRLKLCELISEAQTAFLNNRFSATHAVPVARLSALDQLKVLTYLLHGYTPPPGGKIDTGEGEPTVCTVRELNAWIDQNCHLRLTEAPFPVADALLYEKAGACTACPKNTAVNRELFADVAAKDSICTDGVCYGIKTDAFVKQQAATLEVETGRDVLRVSFRHVNDGEGKHKGILLADHWKLAGPDECADVETAIAVDEGLVIAEKAGDFKEQLFKVGDRLMVCINPLCKVHWKKTKASAANPTANPDIAAHQAEQKQEKANLAIIRSVRQIVARRILSKTKWPVILRSDVVVSLQAVFENAPSLPEMAKSIGEDLKFLEREALKAATAKPATEKPPAKSAGKKPGISKAAARLIHRIHSKPAKKGKHHEAKAKGKKAVTNGKSIATAKEKAKALAQKTARKKGK